MADNTENSELLERWAPWLFTLVAFANALLYSNSDSAAVQQYCPVLFAFSLGSALVLWGNSAQAHGVVRGARVKVHRVDNPLVFKCLLFGKFYIPGVIMMLATLWYLGFGG